LPLTLCSARKRGLGGGGGRDRRSKKGKSDRNSDVRHRRSHKSYLVMGVGCEEHEKTCTVVWSFTPQEGARDQSYPLTMGMEGATERKRSRERILLQGI